MEAREQSLDTKECVSLTEAVFGILVYYQDKSESSILGVSVSPFRLQVLCSYVTDNALNQCPFVVKQVISYIRQLDYFEERKHTASSYSHLQPRSSLSTTSSAHKLHHLLHYLVLHYSCNMLHLCHFKLIPYYLSFNTSKVSDIPDTQHIDAIDVTCLAKSTLFLAFAFEILVSM